MFSAETPPNGQEILIRIRLRMGFVQNVSRVIGFCLLMPIPGYVAAVRRFLASNVSKPSQTLAVHQFPRFNLPGLSVGGIRPGGSVVDTRGRRLEL